jgi:hypothetical protein
VPAYRRFTHALGHPAETQWHVLRANLARNATTAYGRAHGFAAIRRYEDFARQVPVVDYDAVEPWIARIRRGEQAVLTQDPVTRLLPTSGSSGARKLIPFTTSLQRDFNAAIGPWMLNLARQHSAILGGPAYWSITPMGFPRETERSAVPIGFDDDAGYLGGLRASLVNAVMAVPSSVRHIAEIESFRRTVLTHLLCCGDLRLISVWHPSFLTLLLDTLERDWDALIAGLPAPRRRALRHRSPKEPETLWPSLRVISCWGDAHAAAPMEELRRRFPNTAIQAKGLLATEAFISLPFGVAHPLAIGSHFFEFVDASGNLQPLEELREGDDYEVIVTTSGGLYRYRLGDRVEVTGWVGRTPSIRFLGRSGNVSDRCGEKLSDIFVTRVLATLCRNARFAMLAPEPDGHRWHYTLFLETDDRAEDLAHTIDAALRTNPHYANCRLLGQLGPVSVVRILQGAYEIFTAAETARGCRLGDIKPVALSLRTDWRERFGKVGRVIPNAPLRTPAHSETAD